MKICLGIDTSCYTTSLALMDSEGNLLSEARKLLKVPNGARGLSQSEAVFQHINNLPELVKNLFKENSTGISGKTVHLVSASVRPRPLENSYMPVFKVAESYGKSIATLLNVPFISTSHQEGHIAAGIWSAKIPKMTEFLAIHVSGGTTELLKVKTRNLSENAGYDIDLIGGSNDLHAGQFVDRVGVALGLPFPAGPHLEEIAKLSKNNISLPSSVKGYNISFSGPESAAQRLLKSKTSDPQDIARAVEKCIALSLTKVLKKAIEETGYSNILVVGGVSSNNFIRQKLISEIKGYKGSDIHFAETAYSSDNAVGVSAIGACFSLN